MRLVRNRWLRPFAQRLLDRRLWKPTPHTIGLGMALGMFFGILMPVAQMLFAVGSATMVRANVMVAALGTLITNPFTAPPIYLAAYQLGAGLTGGLSAMGVGPAPRIEAFSFDALMQAVSSASWSGAACAFVVGLLVIASLAGLAGYGLGWCASRLLGHARQDARVRA